MDCDTYRVHALFAVGPFAGECTPVSRRHISPGPSLGACAAMLCFCDCRLGGGILCITQRYEFTRSFMYLDNRRRTHAHTRRKRAGGMGPRRANSRCDRPPDQFCESSHARWSSAGFEGARMAVKHAGGLARVIDLRKALAASLSVGHPVSFVPDLLTCTCTTVLNGRIGDGI